MMSCFVAATVGGQYGSFIHSVNKRLLCLPVPPRSMPLFTKSTAPGVVHWALGNVPLGHVTPGGHKDKSRRSLHLRRLLPSAVFSQPCLIREETEPLRGLTTMKS